ncbi:hypothetical protein N9W89_13595 [Hellea sp.]|nr:hypothetical protein [Hellea sp.]
MKFLTLTLDGKPSWRIVLRGAAIPGVIVGACALIAIVYALFNGSDIVDTVKIGIGLGVFFSLFGVIEIVVGILFSSKDIKTNSLLILGYLLVWGACMYIIFS